MYVCHTYYIIYGLFTNYLLLQFTSFNPLKLSNTGIIPIFHMGKKGAYKAK